MAKKKKTNRTGNNIKLNASRRLEKAKRKWKSKNYIADLEAHVSKLH